MRSETLHAVIPVALAAGLALSLLAAYETLNPATQGFCSLSAFFSCTRVATSGFTATFGIPDWAWGVAGFGAMLLVDARVYRRGRGPWLDLLTGLSGLGLALSIYFAAVELVQIGAFCLVCAGAYGANIVVLGSAIVLRRGPSRPPVAAGAGAAE